MIPIWIADYVLMEYGTGAIMAVPGHDERDFEFATDFRAADRARRAARRDAIRARRWPSAYVDDARRRASCNSGQFNGIPVGEAKRAIVTLARASTPAQRRRELPPPRLVHLAPALLGTADSGDLLRCAAARCRCRSGTCRCCSRTFPDFKPDDSGVSPLARHEEWYRVPCPQCGKQARRETDVSDTFLDSGWYFLRYPSVGRDDVAVRPAITEEMAARELVHRRQRARGAAPALFAIPHDGAARCGLRSIFEEPFTKFRAHGMIIRDGAKMSKSKGNVVNPDDYIERWGADTFRTYLMFLGPFEEGGDFRDAGISGVRRFLDRLWMFGARRARRRRAGPRRDAQAASDDPKVGDDIPSSRTTRRSRR